MGTLSGTEDGGRLFFKSDIFDAEKRPRRPASDQTVHEPGRDIPVHATCDVLVVGGGPAGTRGGTCSRAARRRCDPSGALQTIWAVFRPAGLVIWIDRMSGLGMANTSSRAFAAELLDRFAPKARWPGRPAADWGSRDAATAAYWSLRTSAFHGIVTHSAHPGSGVAEGGVARHATIRWRAPGVPRLGRCAVAGRWPGRGLRVRKQAGGAGRCWRR